MTTNPILPMKLNKFLVLLLLANVAFAQHTTTAKIKPVATDGLYRIILPPQIRSFSQEDLSDFRIFDQNKKEVPYQIITGDTPQKVPVQFEEFPILSRIVVPKKNTAIIFGNPNPTINEITLYIANSEVTKKYNISGSNDQKEWFGLVNARELSDLKSEENTQIAKVLSFPLCSYRYLKIEFDDKKTLPINILKVGKFNSHIKNGALQQITPKSTKINQFLPRKTTGIQVTFDDKQIINQIIFSIESPNLYKRNARIYLNKTQTVKNKIQKFEETIYNFELSSEGKNTFDIPQLFEKEFFIEIENQDNQPLGISEIKCNQIPISVIADLKSNENYTVTTGIPNLGAPNYDLSYFKNLSFETFPLTQIIEIKHEIPEAKITKNKSIWQQSWFLWMCIAIGGIAILYFTTSLVKDMKNNS